jgi:hypothetical protein
VLLASNNISRTVDGLNRHRDRVLAGCGGDLGRARKARAHVRHVLVQRNGHLEVGGLRCIGIRRRRLNGTVPDLGDMSAKRPIGGRVNRDFGLLAERDERDVRLVHFDLGFDHRHVGDRQQHRPGLFMVPTMTFSPSSMFSPRDDAFHRGRDDDLAQVVARRREACCFLLDLLFAV